MRTVCVGEDVYGCGFQCGWVVGWRWSIVYASCCRAVCLPAPTRPLTRAVLEGVGCRCSARYGHAHGTGMVGT